MVITWNSVRPGCELLLARLGSVCSAMAEKHEYLMVPLELEKLQCM